ncbi:MAG: Gfo/Idh/MocA family oxidoreductase [Verrucomicrobiaceae bacterium]
MKTGKLDFPLRTAIAGIGGFGSAHHGVFARLEKRGEARVVATCDPALDRLGEVCQSHQFAERGVRSCRDFEEMLGNHPGQFDLGVIAAPIHLHARMHEAFLRNGAACYLEKPPTLDPQEFAQMLAVEKSAPFPTNVGFAYVHLQDRLDLKRRIMTGEFGALKRLSFLGLARRGPAYFLRNGWAGRLMHRNSLVLDSCLGNAMAHFVNNLLFFANQSSLQEWARPSDMACELYRANPIEGTDTIFALSRLENGIELRLAASHACPNESELFEETLEFEDATITICSATKVAIQRPGVPVETFSIAGASLDRCVENYCCFLTGDGSRPAQTLLDCLGFVETNALLYLAGKQIHDIPARALENSATESFISLPDVEIAARRLISEATLPSEAGFTWAAPGGECGVEAIPNLHESIRHMLGLQKDISPGHSV